MAGVNLSASSMTALYAEAVYNFSTVHADFYDPVYNAVVRESLDFNGLAIHGGLRLRFSLSPKRLWVTLAANTAGPRGDGVG